MTLNFIANRWILARMTTDTTHSIVRAAKSFFAGTALSRVSGLLRDIATAISFGSSPEIAAFMVSYRLANLFRSLLGEGSLRSAFIPHFIELKERSALFYRDVLFSMGAILLSLILVLEGVFWGVSQMVGADWRLSIELAMWMVPGLFFICLYGLNSALLQCHHKYFLPAGAPIAFNLIWIFAVLYKPNVWFLAVAVVVAFAGQWFVTVFEGVRLLSWKEWLRPRLFSPECKILLKSLMMGIVGSGAMQFNSALDAIFARMADLEGPAFLWYAIRIQQLPLALFGIALSGALLPPLSRTQDPVRRRELLCSALEKSVVPMLVCTFGIFALGRSGINLLYRHGDFSLIAVQETCYCLWGYGAGLVPAVFILLFSSSFYAEKNYRTPAMASLIAVGTNICLNALFVCLFGWGAVSVAIATSLSAVLNMALLSKGALTRVFALFFSKVTLACALPAVITLIVQTTMEPNPRELMQQVAQFAVLSCTYLSLLGAMVWRFRLYKFH